MHGRIRETALAVPRGGHSLACPRGAPSPARYTRVHQHVRSYTRRRIGAYTYADVCTCTYTNPFPPCTLDRPQHRRAAPRRAGPRPGPSSKSPPLTSTEHARSDFSPRSARVVQYETRRRQAGRRAAVARGRNDTARHACTHARTHACTRCCTDKSACVIHADIHRHTDISAREEREGGKRTRGHVTYGIIARGTASSPSTIERAIARGRSRAQ